MTEVVSIRFKNRGKAYFFAPAGIAVPEGADVIVETAKGLELGQCSRANHYVVDERVVQPLRAVVRLATAADKRVADINKNREKEAFGICQKKILEHGLDMKLVDVECSFEGNKTTFFFTSDGRVDFRELVKDLAGVFRNRIELRQIGVRDEAKMLGGLGICGRPFCCSQFLEDFQPVSTKMAKVQSMSLNPTKISGTCGRLMCCLRYEEEAYEDLLKSVPKQGTFVETPDGYGQVSQVTLLRRKVKVRMDGNGEEAVKSYGADDVAVVPGGRPKPGEKPPEILKYRPVKEKEPEDAEVVDFWKAPSLIAEDMNAAPRVARSPEEPRETAEVPVKKMSSHRRGRGGRGNGGKPQSEGGQPQQPKGQQQSSPKGEGQRRKEPRRDNQSSQSKSQQPKPQQQPNPQQSAGEGGAGQGGGNHRRRRSNKPRPPKGDGQAPKE